MENINVLLVSSPIAVEEPGAYTINRKSIDTATLLEENSIKARYFNTNYLGGFRKNQVPMLKDYLSYEERWEGLFDFSHPKWVSLKKTLRKTKPEVVFTTAIKPYTFETSLMAAKLSKKISDSKTVVLHRSESFTESFLEKEYIDFVLEERGDAEKLILSASQSILNNDIESGINLYYKENGELKKTREEKALIHPDDLPMPRWKLAVKHKFYPPSAFGMLLASKGCKWGNLDMCDFCPSNSELRLRDPKKISREIREVSEKYGTREFVMKCNSFNMDKEWSKKVCDLISRENKDIVWSSYANTRGLGRELTEKMKLSGCHQLFIGFESGSPRTLKRMGKPTTIEESKKAAEVVRNSGIDLRGGFIIGFPGERAEDVKKTLNFMRELNVDIPVLQFYVPDPSRRTGAETRKTKKIKAEDREHLVEDRNFWSYSISKKKTQIKGLDDEEIKRIWKEWLKTTNRKEMKTFLKRLLHPDFFRPKIIEYWNFFVNQVPNQHHHDRHCLP